MKSVLVTGASGGVGRATVARLGGAGWQVFAGVRRLDAAGGLPAVAVRLDVTDAASIEAAVGVIGEHVGADGLQGVVNNAGISVDGPLELVPADALRRQFEVNVIGAVAVTQALLPLLRAGGGRVVNVGGAAGRSTLPMYGALSASKAALDTLSDALRMELRHQGVHVSYIEPGGLDTGFFATASEAARADRLGAAPEAERIYAAAIEAAARSLAAAPTSPVQLAVDGIERALDDRRPAARYRIGRDARVLLPVLRRLPVGLRDRLVTNRLGLGPEAFGV